MTPTTAAQSKCSEETSTTRTPADVFPGVCTLEDTETNLQYRIRGRTNVTTQPDFSFRVHCRVSCCSIMHNRKVVAIGIKLLNVPQTHTAEDRRASI